MEKHLIAGLERFLRDQPLMAVRPENSSNTVLKGRFSFIATTADHGTVGDSFELEIRIPPNFPDSVPVVFETANRIPRDGQHHRNSSDGSLCLGSPLRLRVELLQNPSLDGFAEYCIVPYLFAVSRKLQSGEAFVFNELPHGTTGALLDYQNLFGLQSLEQARTAIFLLSIKKRLANKRPCPCDCGKRLGKCRFNRKMAVYRKIAPRSWYKFHSLA